jgi:lysophospholipase L1-like esterase
MELLEDRSMLSATMMGPFGPAAPSADSRAPLATFVDALYRDFLSRSADQAGISYWSAQLDHGVSRLAVAMTFAKTDEHFADLVHADYRDDLGHDATAGDVGYWLAQRHAGLTESQLNARIIASDEFYYRAGGNDGAWLEAVYDDVLGRGAAPTSVSYWLGRLTAGGARGEVASNIVDSAEHVTHEVDSDYRLLLDQPSDAGGLAFWSAQIEHGGSNNIVAANLAASSTYFKLKTGIADSVVPVANDEPFWQADNAKINAQAQQGNSDLLFVGDSITYGWQLAGQSVWNPYYATRRAMLAGIPGDQTQNVLWRIDHGNLDGIRPKLVVLMIGTNNETDPPDDVAAGVMAIVQDLRVQLPEANMLLLGILPRGSMAADPQRQKDAVANGLLRGLAAGQDVNYLDLTPAFLNEDGTLRSGLIQSDDVHPTAQGYAVIADALEPIVAPIAGPRPINGE